MIFDIYSLQCGDKQIRCLTEEEVFKQACRRWDLVKEFYKTPTEIEPNIELNKWEVDFPDIDKCNWEDTSHDHYFKHKSKNKSLVFIPETIEWDIFDCETMSHTRLAAKVS